MAGNICIQGTNFLPSIAYFLYLIRKDMYAVSYVQLQMYIPY
jgi:hypothetical protein